ncbi:hypothetical protein PAERUG_P2_London_28_IMP_1_06_05_05451 [Pseudomonas aeruginosa]|nr:hypothetical protein PAERUG_P2_London_28_IMP_1_06_05_05451 [Pseudomonas aeruginosa]
MRSDSCSPICSTRSYRKACRVVPSGRPICWNCRVSRRRTLACPASGWPWGTAITRRSVLKCRTCRPLAATGPAMMPRSVEPSSTPRTMSRLRRSCRSTVTPGRAARKPARISGRNSVTAVVLAKMRICPAASLPYSVNSLFRYSTWRMISRACCSRRWPAGVSSTPRLSRYSRRLPSWPSSALTRALAAAGERKARRAPWVRLGDSAIWMNRRRSARSKCMGTPWRSANPNAPLRNCKFSKR